jgi:hypothetical protein
VHSPTSHQVHVWLSPVHRFQGFFPFVATVYSDRDPFRDRVHLCIRARWSCKISISENDSRARTSFTDTQRFLPLKPQPLSDDHRPSSYNRSPIDHTTLSLQKILIEDLFEVKVSVLGTLHFFGRSIGELIINGAPFPFLGRRRPGRGGVGCLGVAEGVGWLIPSS